MPNTQSQEKIDLLRMLGAEVYPVPAVPFDNPENYNHQARRHAESLDNAVWTNQFDNVANRQAHIESTGPEIWAQTNGGEFDGFIAATGTGGTLAGTTRYLKDKSQGRIQCWLADPPGSVLHQFIQNKKLERTGNGSMTEGIGQGRITENLKPEVEAGLIDNSLHVPDADSIRTVYEMLDEEGIYIGASSALNVWAAGQMGAKMGKGSRIVTIICDGAYRYQNRECTSEQERPDCAVPPLEKPLTRLSHAPAGLFSRKWLESKGLDKAIPDHLQRYIVLP